MLTFLHQIILSITTPSSFQKQYEYDPSLKEKFAVASGYKKGLSIHYIIVACSIVLILTIDPLKSADL